IDEPLSQRVNEYIKAGVACLVSIHHNAYTSNWNSATGVEVYTDRNPIPADTKLAELVYDRLVKYTGLKGRGIKTANFYVINQNKVPAVLVEGGFMDGTFDYKVITSDAGQTNYARAVAEGLISFCGLKKKTTPAIKKPEVIYRIHDYRKKKWLNNITGITGKGVMAYAGNIGNEIDALEVHLTSGNVYYKVHVKGTTLTKGRWLPEVKNLNDYAGNLEQPIDAVMLRTDTGKTIHYGVHELQSGRWLPEVTGYNENNSRNGYAGNFGREIDAVRIWVE
ncbi:MAG: N-acetylmuramoyl-L-alanine amidase, partial [Clostridia bacterium]|nr:N-acetylmuramoyl-L-alanine amidase [Clostridia bacterium]